MRRADSERSDIHDTITARRRDLLSGPLPLRRTSVYETFIIGPRKDGGEAWVDVLAPVKPTSQ